MRCKIVVFISILLFFSITFQAKAEESPLSIVEASIGEILNILASEEYKNEETRPQMREKIFSITDDKFSWEEIGKRCLGRKWRDQTEKDREKFVELFTKLLKENYIEKLEIYSQEEVIYVKEILKGKYAEVRTQIVQKKGEKIPVYYRMINRGNGWLVYDVVIEGISLVKNYRSQFDDMLGKSTFKEFLENLKEKVSERKK